MLLQAAQAAIRTIFTFPDLCLIVHWPEVKRPSVLLAGIFQGLPAFVVVGAPLLHLVVDGLLDGVVDVVAVAALARHGRHAERGGLGGGHRQLHHSGKHNRLCTG